MNKNKPIDFGPKQMWVEIFADGPTNHPAGEFDINDDFRANLLKSFKFLRKKYNYYPPFTAEHPEIAGELIGEPIVDGAVYGLIANLRVTDAGGIEAKFKLNDLGKRLADSGGLTYVSPSFFTTWTDPHTGTVLGPVLREVSAVCVPHQKNLNTDLQTAYRLSESADLNSNGFTEVSMEGEEKTVEETDLEEGQTEEEPTEAAEMSPELEAKIVELVTQAVAAAMAGDVEESVEDVSMSERVEALEGQLRTERNLNAVREEHPGLSKATAQDLAAVRMHDEARYKRLSKLVSVDMSETKPQGNAGKAPAQSSFTADQVVSLAEEAAKSGIKRGRPFVKFMRSRGVANDAINASLEDPATRSRVADAYSVHG